MKNYEAIKEVIKYEINQYQSAWEMYHDGYDENFDLYFDDFKDDYETYVGDTNTVVYHPISGMAWKYDGNVSLLSSVRWYIVGNDGNAWAESQYPERLESMLGDCFDDDTVKEYELEIMPSI